MAERAMKESGRGQWRDLLPVAAPFLAFVSVAAYAIMRVSYERFYAQFGVTPEDVGANSTAILGESGARVFAYSVLFAIIPYGLSLAVFYFAARRRRHGVRGWLFVILAALFPLAAYQEVTGAGILGAYVAVVLAGLVALACWVGWKGPGVNWGHIAVVSLSFGIVWLNLRYLPASAARAGRCVVESHDALRFVHTHRHLPFLGPTAVLSLPVERARVSWLGNPLQRPSFGPHLLYLGQASGTVVLYDADRGRALRVPAADALISTRRRERLCRDTRG
jgi:hypothetical protein